jgi:thioredoxin-related protein
MESFVSVVTQSNYDDFINTDLTKYNVLLFTNKGSTPALFKAISKELKDKLNFGMVKASENELITKFNIQSYPTLMVLTHPFTYQGKKYEGT